MPTIDITAFLNQVIAFAKNDVLKAALPIISQFLTNVSSDPSTLNITAQLVALEGNLLAALPSTEAQVIKDINAVLQQQIAALQAASTQGKA